MSKTVENLKTLKQLGFGTFKAIETIGYERSKSVWKLLKHYDKVFADLGIEDPDEQSRLIKLLEYELTECANAGIPKMVKRGDSKQNIHQTFFIHVPAFQQSLLHSPTTITFYQINVS